LRLFAGTRIDQRGITAAWRLRSLCRTTSKDVIPFDEIIAVIQREGVAEKR
jgi:hypothetical protein